MEDRDGGHLVASADVLKVNQLLWLEAPSDWKQRERGEPTKQPHLLLNPDSVQIRERHVFPRDLASTKPIGGECPGSYSVPALLQSSPERKTPGPSPEEGDWGGAGRGGGDPGEEWGRCPDDWF